MFYKVVRKYQKRYYGIFCPLCFSTKKINIAKDFRCPKVKLSVRKKFVSGATPGHWNNPMITGFLFQKEAFRYIDDLNRGDLNGKFDTRGAELVVILCRAIDPLYVGVIPKPFYGAGYPSPVCTKRAVFVEEVPAES